MQLMILLYQLLSCILRMSFLLICSCLCAPSAMAESAETLKVDAYLLPARPVLAVGKQSTSATLHLVNRSSAPIAIRIEGVHLIQKASGASGNLHFKRTGTSVSPEILLGAGAGSSANISNGNDLEVEFATVLNSGVYEAAFDIVSLAGPEQRKRVLIELSRPGPAPGPTVRGTQIIGGAMVLKPQSSIDNSFTFFVQNPENAPDTEFTIEIVQPAGRKGLLAVAAVPPKFQLAPSQSRAVVLHIDNLKESGSYSGTVLISSLNGAQKDFPLLIEPSYLANWTMVFLFGLVMSGTGFSILVGTVIPTMVARRKAWQKLDEMQNRIDRDLTRASAVQVALTAARRRIEFLVAQIHWYSPQATAELAEIAKQTSTLAADVDLVCQVNYERDLVRRVAPVSMVAKFIRDLDEVGDEVVAGNSASALLMFQAIQTQIHDPGLLQAVKDKLIVRIGALPDPEPDNKPDLLIPDLIIRGRVKKLKQMLPQLAGTPDPADIITIDGEWYAIHLYVDHFIGRLLLRQPKFEFMGKAVLEELSNGAQGTWRATELVRSMECGVLPADIVDAISTSALLITVMPAEPKERELAEFRFSFRESRLNDSPLISRMTFHWSFGDDTSPASGQRCVHFFKEAEKPRSFSLLLKRLGLKVKVSKTFAVTCAISYMDELPQIMKTNVLVRSGSKTNYRLIGSEITSTITVFVGAVALSFISHMAEMHAFESIQDVVNPFLWGFGLDQMKGLVAKNKAAA